MCNLNSDISRDAHSPITPVVGISQKDIAKVNTQLLPVRLKSGEMTDIR